MREFGVSVKPELVNEGTQVNLRNCMDSGTETSPPPVSVPKATQLCSVLGLRSGSSQTPCIKSQDVSSQAFEEDPWQGLLTEDEVCDLIKVEQAVGLGIVGKPEAKFQEHDITCKRMLSNGIIYQVVVLKEQYTVEKEVVKERIVVKEKTTPKVEKLKEKVTEKVKDKVKEKVKEKVTEKKDRVEIIEIDLETEETEEVSKESEDRKDFLVVKEEEVVEVDSIEVVEDLESFKDKPWLNLRRKIVENQVRKTPDPVIDNRTPYQRMTEKLQEPGPVPLEINSHINLALQDIQEFLNTKPLKTAGFLPLAVSRNVMQQYRTYVEPGFALGPEVALQLEGLLSGVAFAGRSKKGVPFSSAELEKLALVAFNILEIMSFMMAAIAVIDGGLQSVVSKVKGQALTSLLEYKPFLGSLDKACRHVVRESLAIMTSAMMKQRHALTSCASVALPAMFKSKINKAPLTTFEIAPKEAFEDIKKQFDSFIRDKAFTQAVVSLSANRSRGTTRVFRQRTTVISRGTRTRGYIGRALMGARGLRGQYRSALRGVRSSGLSVRNMRAFARRDRAVGRGRGRQIRDNETGGSSEPSSR